MFVRELVFAAALLLIVQSAIAQCEDGRSITFTRWSGVSPEGLAPVFVYSARGDEPSLPAACLARCRELTECAAVALVHGKGRCHGLAATTTTQLRVDNDATYYQKICVEVTAPCDERWWALESTAGYHLHAEGRDLKVVLNATARECYAAVFSLSDHGNHYKSAQWVAPGQEFDAELMTMSDDVTGNCVLNTENKFTEPESYRVANFHTLYIENQCRHDYPDKIDRCSYEEYYNQTLRHVELTLNVISKDECKKACEQERHFVCRGFTWSERESALGVACSLHSEDLLTVGSWLMRRATDANYYRRVICLNITVECTDDELVLRYHPRGVFRGRVYVPGRGERCGARADGGRVRLALPLRGDCDVNFAHAIANGPNGRYNRTMAYVMVMIQNNAIIQTAGDRWVRVGCSPPRAEGAAHVHAAITVTQHTKPSLISEAAVGVTNEAAASAVFNNSGWTRSPVTMYVVRADADSDVAHAAHTAVSLGETLELRIETTEEAEIEAYHLVASSRLGDSSVLLLDSQGCSTGQVDFPSFTRTWFGGTQRLWARFKAFRFPTSHIVRFAIMVRFCEGRCLPRNCGRGRSAREVNETSSILESAAAVREDSAWRVVGTGADTGAGGVIAQSGVQPCGAAPAGRVPLELELIVGSKDMLSADTLVQADHHSIIPSVAGVGGVDGMAGAATEGVVCMHEVIVVALALSWLAVQLLLLLGCCLLVKRYRNLAEISMQKEYQSFDNVGFDSLPSHRRVHWPDQSVDILHAT